eukprot:393761-Ditylum_brightwellii.AAC.1
MSRVIHQGALLYIARNIKQNKTWAIMIHLLVKENQSWRNYGFSSSCAILCLSFFPSVPAVTSMFPVIELQLPHFNLSFPFLTLDFKRPLTRLLFSLRCLLLLCESYVCATTAAVATNAFFGEEDNRLSTVQDSDSLPSIERHCLI